MLLADNRFKLAPPEALAEDVVRGLARSKALIVAPGSARAQWLLWRLGPPLSTWFSLKLTRSYRDMVRAIDEQAAEGAARG